MIERELFKMTIYIFILFWLMANGIAFTIQIDEKTPPKKTNGDYFIPGRQLGYKFGVWLRTERK